MMDQNGVSGSKRTLEGNTATEQPSKVSKIAEVAQPNTCVKNATKAETAPSTAKAAQHISLVLKAAVSCDKGTRTTMEDVHVCLIDTSAADGAAESNNSSSPAVSHFAVYDGHGGAYCAQFVSQRLHEAVIAAGLLTCKQNANSSSASSCNQQQPWQLDVKAAKQAIIKGFTSTDELLLKECAQRNWQDGAAAAAVWIVNQETVLVANVGDVRCVLARKSDKNGSLDQLRALVLTKDHLAMYPGERARIEKAGGHVSADGRLNGRIQVSRAFGDAQFKPFGSSATPDVTAFNICGRDQFLLCACDGFWSVMDPQGAVQLVQQQIATGQSEKAITNRLIHEAVIRRRCKDNCTIMLVKFDRPSLT